MQLDLFNKTAGFLPEITAYIKIYLDQLVYFNEGNKNRVLRVISTSPFLKTTPQFEGDCYNL